MQFGFEGNLYINTGTAAEPVWTELDVAGDFDNEDQSDEVDTTVRSTNGIKTTARGLMARGFSFSIESAAEPGAGLAALIAASKTRQGFCDLFASNSDASEGATGTRMLALITRGEKQPMGDRWIHEFTAKPARATGAWATANVAPLNEDYEVTA